MGLFSRIMNLFKGKASRAVSAMEHADPEALLELERQKIREAEGKYNQGLIKHAAQVEKLKSMQKKLTTEKNDLEIKTEAHLNAGNTKRAAEMSLRLETAERQLAQVTTDLATLMQEEQNLIRARDVSVKAARDKIESISRNIEEMRRNQGLAELHQAASGLITDIGGTGDTINRLDEIVERNKNEAAGAARIAQSNIHMDEINETQTEHDALANAALAKFAARKNKNISSTEVESTQKTMGPASQTVNA